MSAFQIVDANTVTLTKGAHTYTVTRHGAGWRVCVVNPVVHAYRRGFATPRDFDSLADVEKRYKGLAGIAAAFEPAAELPEGWTEATPGGMATNRDPARGGIVDTAIATGEWFAIANCPGVAPIDGLASRAEAFAALEAAIRRNANQFTRLSRA